MITGEIKRYLRDQGMIKVSRSLKEINAKAYRVHEALFAESGREPGLEEIAEKIAVTREELVMAMEAGAQIESLQKMIYQGDGSGIVLEDKIEEPENRQESLLNKNASRTASWKPGGKRAGIDLSAVFSGKNTDADCRRTWNFAGSGVENGEKDFKSFKGTD
mgnify:CR=1 FL=1